MLSGQIIDWSKERKLSGVCLPKMPLLGDFFMKYAEKQPKDSEAGDVDYD